MPEPGGPRVRRRPAPPVQLDGKIRIVIADDHLMVREGLRALLLDVRDFEIIGEAADGREAVRVVLREKPRVVLMDLGMPILNGLEATRQIIAALPATRILMLTAHADIEYVARAQELGAAGYVLKRSSLDVLGNAVRHVAAGGRWTSSKPGRIAMGPGVPTLPVPRLTVREAEVLQLVAEGHANKQSAARLGISIKTVEKHRQSLMTKLDIHDVAGLTRYAISTGTIEGRNRVVPD